MEIVSYFTDIFSVEVLIQGAFFTMCLTFGLFMILSDQRSYFKGVTNFREYRSRLILLIQNYFKKVALVSFLQISKDLAKDGSTLRFIMLVNSLSIGVLFLIISLINGTIIHSISDKWISLPSQYHLGMKFIWNSESIIGIEESLKLNSTNDAIKVKTFKVVMSDLETAKLDSIKKSDTIHYTKTIKEIFYRAKHELLTIDVWREYLQSTQNLVNITESFSLSFYFLFWLCYLNFLINIFRDFFDKPKDNAVAIFLPMFVFITINFVIIGLKEDSSAVSAILLIFPLITMLVVGFLSHKAHVSIYYSITSVLLIYVSSFGYAISGKAWLQNSIELSSKTFGVYRYQDSELRNETDKSIKKLLKGS